MSRKNKNYIDQEETASELMSRGFDVKIMPNGYQLRVRMPDLTDSMYDWYWTSGVVVVTRPDRVPSSLRGYAYDGLQLAELIFKTEEEQNYI